MADQKAPPGLYQGPTGIWFIDKWTNGRRIKRSTKTTNLEVAGAVMERELRMLNHRLWGDEWDLQVQAMVDDAGSWLRRTAQSVAYRGKKIGKGCQLDIDDLAQMMRRSGGQCELTGIPFDMSRSVSGKAPPFYPSIDRIEAAKGYTYSNTRVVCLCVNLCIRDWGADVIHRIGRALVLRELKASVMTHCQELSPPVGDLERKMA